MPIRFTIFAVLVFSFPQTDATEPVSNEADLKAHMEKLDPKNSQKARLDALKWIIEKSKEPFAKTALPALESYAKNEKDEDIRAEVVLAIGRIGLDQRPRMVWPMILLEALEDKCVFVRQNASALAGQFKRFPPTAVEFLLRLEKADNPDNRSDAHQLLAQAGAKDERVPKVLRRATLHNDFWVAHNARVFLFQVTNDLEDIVPYFIRYHANWVQNYATTKNATEEEHIEKSRRDLTGLGIVTRLHELEGKRPDEMAAAYLKLLRSNEVTDRRAISLYVGQFFACESSSDKAAKEKPKLDPKAKNPLPWDNVKFPKTLANKLRELKIGELLQKLSKDDSDEVVKKIATIALEMLSKTIEENK